MIAAAVLQTDARGIAAIDVNADRFAAGSG